MDSAVPRILKTPILAMYHDDKHQYLTLEVELPDVENENITLLMHENSFYLKAFSKTIEYLGAFFLDWARRSRRSNCGQRKRNAYYQSSIQRAFYMCKVYSD